MRPNRWNRLKNWVLYSARYYRPHKELKYLLQKLCYGFSYKDTWSLDLPLARMIVKALKAFERWGLDDKFGYPGWLDLPVESSFNDMAIPDHVFVVGAEDHYSETSKLVWIAIIHRLIDGFERIAKGSYICVGYEEYEEETLALFEKVYPSLWT